jgi:hypothetical protein
MKTTWKVSSWVLAVAGLLLSLAVAPAFGQITFNDFSNVSSLALNGSAAQATNTNQQQVLRLTPDKTQHVSGTAWFATQQQSIASGFTTVFTFQITHASSQADGLAFIIQNSSGSGFGTAARGGSGGAIGYGVPDPGDNGVAIPNSVAVEFDTYDNTAWDPNANHIAVQSCGTDPNTQNHLAICPDGNPANLGIVSNLGTINLADGNVHTAVVDYDPGTLRVFVDDLGTPLLVVNTDLSTLLSLNNGSAWVGFSGATGALTENNDIQTWTFTPATTSTSITQTLTPNTQQPVATNYVFGSYNHKVQYTGANSGDGVTVTAIPVDQTTFHDTRLAGTPFTNAQCVIYDGTGGLCVEFEVTCTQTAGTDCSTLNYDLFNNFNTSQTITGAGVLKAPIGTNNWANIIETFTQTRNDPGTHSGSKGFSDFILVQNATAPPSITNVSPANQSTVLVGQNVTVTFTCGTDPNAPLVTLSSCTATLNGNPVTNNSTVVFNQPGTGTLVVTGTDSVLDTNTVTSNFTIGTAPSFTSAASTTLQVGTPGTFTVMTTGSPAAAISESGSLPGGVTLQSNGDGTGTLGGTPAVNSGGVYNITLMAVNSAGSATQPFALTVNDVSNITSPNSTTFTTGTPGSFTVTATGFPAPTITETGALPSGVNFSGGVLSGTPASGSGGTYSLTFTAHNGIGTDASQKFTLTVNDASVFTSANNATFTVGTAGSFAVTASGYPAPTISEAGALPSGVTFAGGVLSGTPAAGTGGAYNLVFTAHNGVGADVMQNFTLTVNQAAAITSAASTTFTVGTPGSFTVTATGFPAPVISESGGLPSGVAFINGVLSGTPATGTGGTYNLVFTAHNGVGADASQNFILTVLGPMVSVSPTSVNFGTVYLYNLVWQNVTLQNIGTSSVQITSVSVANPSGDSDEFGALSLCGSSLAAGKSCVISVIFFADDVATDAATLNITTSASVSPLQVPITATVVKKKGH